MSNTITLPSSETDRKEIAKMLRELSGAMSRAEAERDYIKESIKELCEKYELPKKEFRKLVRVYHKQNYSEEVATSEAFQELYDGLVDQAGV